MITLYTKPARQVTAILLAASSATLLLSVGNVSAQGYGSQSNSGSSSGYTDPDADPALLADGTIRVTTPRGNSITACDDNETIFWTWTGDQTAAYYHRVDIYTASNTLSAGAIDPAAVEADQAAGSPLPAGLTLISPARGIRLSEQEWRWRPVNVGADSYTIYIIVRDLPAKFGQSGVFSVQEGDDTSCIITTGASGSGPSGTTSTQSGNAAPTSSSNNGGNNNNNNNGAGGSNSSSSGSSSGTIAAAVAIPIVVILAALVGFFCYRRRKRAQAASSSRYANVPSSGGAAGAGAATGLLGRKSNDARANEKQEEMLPIAHSQHLRAMQTPSPMEERALGRNRPTPPNDGRSRWSNRFSGGKSATTVAGAGAVGATAGAAAAAAQSNKPLPPNEDEKYGAKLASADHGLRSTSAFQDDIAAAAAGGPFNDLHAANNVGSTPATAPNNNVNKPGTTSRPTVAPITTKAVSPTSDNKRPDLAGPSGWYLHAEAQKEVPSLPPSAAEVAFTDETGHGAAEEQEESQSAATSPVAAVAESQPRSDLPAGSTAAAIAAAAAASRVFPPTTPAGQQQQPYNRGSQPPSAYNVAAAPQQQQQQPQGLQSGTAVASASTSTSSLRQHRRQHSGFAGVGAMYAHTPSAALDPPPPSAAMMAPPSAANTTGTPSNSTGSFPGFPVGVSFSPGQIVSFGTASGGNSRSVSSMLGVGSGSPYGPRMSGGAGAAPMASSPPSAAYNQNPGALAGVNQSQSYGSGNGAYPPPPPVMAQPQRPPTPTQMLPPRSSTPSGLIPAGGETGRYPSWYGGSAGTTADPSTTSASSGASSPRMATMSPFGDQHAAAAAGRNGPGAGARSPPRPNH
ncbi:hypothetical protein OC846_003331 [Tilletia horrida]|uniref:Uncharacterized protein n=1 Tax=Tilletia horrida TaxID=155126 RepID=A0AAN6GPY2_9BASI|nr:hypothetical protein OC846_003331 [Tilletia horrida]KAK0568632.1 hypothetical protein OC861_001794 [Tilletia horrida]